MNKCLVLFVEGDTEIEFYKQIVAKAKKLCPNQRFDTKIEYKNMNGVGGFKEIVFRKFKKEIIPKYQGSLITIALCRDSDVFERISEKPPVKWNEVEKKLIDAGANKVIHIEAVHSIEDWFLYDLEGILRFLKLNNKIKVSGNNGYDKLQRLYKKANKIYIKGMNSNGMVACLDLDKITKNIHGQLDPLYKALGVRKN